MPQLILFNSFQVNILIITSNNSIFFPSLSDLSDYALTTHADTQVKAERETIFPPQNV